MKKSFVLLFITLLLISLFLGCVSFNPSMGIMAFGQTATEKYQTLEGERTVESLVIIPVGSSMKKNDDMGLKIGRISLNGNLVKYVFQAEVHTGGSFTLFDSISIKLGNNIYKLKDENPSRQVLHGDYFLEVSAFEISPEMLEEIKITETFSAELYKRVITLTEKQLQLLKDFCSD